MVEVFLLTSHVRLTILNTDDCGQNLIHYEYLLEDA
jgi:hypothetical protein